MYRETCDTARESLHVATGTRRDLNWLGEDVETLRARVLELERGQAEIRRALREVQGR